MPKKASYWDYIRVEELLNLQNGLEAQEQEVSNDEIRFIVIHQIDELWFKLVLRELATAHRLRLRANLGYLYTCEQLVPRPSCRTRALQLATCDL